MKILQIASLGLPVRPDLKYGGTERVVSYLDEAFTKMRHESYVAATGDSSVSGTLLPTLPRSQWSIDGTVSITRAIRRPVEAINEHYRKCIEYLLNKEIDIAHDHPGSGLVTSSEFSSFKKKSDIPILVTLHGAVSQKYKERYAKWANISHSNLGVYFNAISQSQRKEFEGEGIKVENVIYHGIPINKFGMRESKSDYLFSIGRIAPEKGQDIAIEVAKRSGRPLIIAGEVHSVNEDYWTEKIEPFIDGDQIKFVGSLTDEEKAPYFQNAASLIFPLQWKEPFGLVMIEAMASGTPVVAFSRGSVPEVVKDGETGFVIQETGNRGADLEAMVEAVSNLSSINPSDCRKHVEDNFSIQSEAERYISLYEKLVA